MSSDRHTSKSTTKATKPQTKYVECENCSMHSICQPVKSGDQQLDLTTNYLNRRIPVTQNNTSTQKTHQDSIIHGVLFEQAAPLTAIYAVCSGTFKLCVTNKDGSENIVGLRYPGELLGEDALFQEKYNYSAISVGESSVCRVNIDQVSSYGQLVPELQQNLIKLLSKQSFVRQTNFQAFIGKKSADSLLASFLLNVLQRNEAHTGNHNEISLTISRNDIANFLGLRRETLSRVFAKFQKEQLITIDGKSIKFLAQEKLIALAH